jgi:hypothetical protein
VGRTNTKWIAMMRVYGKCAPPSHPYTVQLSPTIPATVASWISVGGRVHLRRRVCLVASHILYPQWLRDLHGIKKGDRRKSVCSISGRIAIRIDRRTVILPLPAHPSRFRRQSLVGVHGPTRGRTWITNNPLEVTRPRIMPKLVVKVCKRAG